MNLHVFNDSHGFFLNLTVSRFVAAGALQNNLFINLNDRTIYTDPHVKYFKKNTLSFKRAARSLPAINSVTFYPLDFTATAFLKELKKSQPAIKVGWVFWGYEYYLHPASIKQNFENFSLAYYKRQNEIFKNARAAVTRILKNILFIPVFNEQQLINGHSQVDKFYSFLPQDFKNVFQNIKTANCQYYPIAFLSIEEMNNKIEWGRLTDEVMIGHAATPTLNHAEILDKLQGIPFPGKLFMPLEYGEEKYRREIKDKAIALFNGRIEFLETRLEMNDYYRRISRAGYAIFNFRWQEGLGNIVFLAWNGTKIFLQKESSVYKQFVAWGLHVFSIEEDLDKENINELLPVEKRQMNKAIIEDLFSEQKIKKYWEPLF